MNILWPGLLFLLGLIPLIVAAYIWILRRRRRFAVRYSSLALIREALHKQSWLRRHLPFVLFLLALASLVVAFARPMAVFSVPAGQSTVILALDVSRSMCQTDIQPNRMEAAKAAALSFIERQDPNTQIGIVAFAGFSELILAPTNDQEALRTAVRSLTTARRTAIGSGILESLDAIAEIYEEVAPTGGEPLPVTGGTPPPEAEFAPYIIVLLTDGASNTGPEPTAAAQEAAARGVRVFTIGFGTDDVSGPIPYCSSGYQGRDLSGSGQAFGGNSFGGGGFRRGIDEETLKQVADMTGGEYYPAESAQQLQEVFQKLPTYAIIKTEFMEVSVVFTAVGALLAALAMLLSLLWHPLP